MALLFASAMSGCSDQTSNPATAGAEPAAAKLYSQNCAPCHRDDGGGVPTVYPSLAGSRVANGDPAELAQWVLNGKRPASLPAGRYTTKMLLFGWMKDPDAAVLLTYIRSHFGNSSPPVDVAAVAGARL